jgi:hypothetical protein
VEGVGALVLALDLAEAPFGVERHNRPVHHFG